MDYLPLSIYTVNIIAVHYFLSLTFVMANDLTHGKNNEKTHLQDLLVNDLIY